MKGSFISRETNRTEPGVYLEGQSRVSHREEKGYSRAHHNRTYLQIATPKIQHDTAQPCVSLTPKGSSVVQTKLREHSFLGRIRPQQETVPSPEGAALN